jgi:hypothetical protein
MSWLSPLAGDPGFTAESATLCLPCAVGYYHADLDLNQCQLCEIGRAAPYTNMTSCDVW